MVNVSGVKIYGFFFYLKHLEAIKCDWTETSGQSVSNFAQKLPKQKESVSLR